MAGCPVCKKTIHRNTQSRLDTKSCTAGNHLTDAELNNSSAHLDNSTDDHTKTDEKSHLQYVKQAEVKSVDACRENDMKNINQMVNTSTSDSKSSVDNELMNYYHLLYTYYGKSLMLKQCESGAVSLEESSEAEATRENKNRTCKNPSPEKCTKYKNKISQEEVRNIDSDSRIVKIERCSDLATDNVSYENVHTVLSENEVLEKCAELEQLQYNVKTENVVSFSL